MRLRTAAGTIGLTMSSASAPSPACRIWVMPAGARTPVRMSRMGACRRPQEPTGEKTPSCLHRNNARRAGPARRSGPARRICHGDRCCVTSPAPFPSREGSADAAPVANGRHRDAPWRRTARGRRSLQTAPLAPVWQDWRIPIDPADVLFDDVDRRPARRRVRASLDPLGRRAGRTVPEGPWPRSGGRAEPRAPIPRSRAAWPNSRPRCPLPDRSPLLPWCSCLSNVDPFRGRDCREVTGADGWPGESRNSPPAVPARRDPAW